MTRPYQLVVFDWEGTLADTLGQVAQIMYEKAESLGYLPQDKSVIGQGIGLGLLNAVKKSFPHLTSEEHHTLLLAVQQSLCAKSPVPCLFPGAVHLIKQLHQMGVILAIATNKGQQSLRQALQKAQLSDYFQVTRAAGQAQPKPHPQMLLEILDTVLVEPRKAVMIGDSVSDIEMAVSVGMDAIGVDFDGHSAAALLAVGAKHIIHHYEELAEFLGVPK